MFHEFPLNVLKSEKLKLDAQTNMLLQGQTAPSNLRLRNHLETLKSIKEACNEKLKYFSFYSKRQKRGAINFIGTGFNWLFGTLDANDKEIYDKAVLELNKNDFKIQEKYDQLWSMNVAAMAEINKTLQNAYVNDNILQNEIDKLNQTVVMHEIEDNIHLYTTKYQIIHSTITELMDSLTFCKHHTLDPVIISPSAYLSHLKNLDNNHIELPMKPTEDNMFLFQEITSVNCAFNSDHILYFLHLPLFTKQSYQVHKLIPVPMFVKSQYFRPRVSPNFVIRYESNVLETQDCLLTTPNSFLCTKPFRSANPCETEALRSHDVTPCHLDPLAIQADFSEIDDNEHLIIYSQSNKTIAYQCASSANHYFLFKGVFLVNPNNCSLSINSKVLKPHKPSLTRLFIPDIQMNPSEIFEKQNLKPLSIHTINSRYEENNVAQVDLHTFTMKYVTIVIILILILVNAYIIISHFFPVNCTRQGKHTKKIPHELETEDKQSLHEGNYATMELETMIPIPISRTQVP